MGEYIILKPDVTEVVSSTSGIIVSVEEEGEVKNTGIIVSKGELCNIQAVRDDRVYFNAQAGTEIEVEGSKLRAIRPQDIIALIIE